MKIEGVQTKGVGREGKRSSEINKGVTQNRSHKQTLSG